MRNSAKFAHFCGGIGSCGVTRFGDVTVYMKCAREEILNGEIDRVEIYERQ